MRLRPKKQARQGEIVVTDTVKVSSDKAMGDKQNENTSSASSSGDVGKGRGPEGKNHGGKCKGMQGKPGASSGAEDPEDLPSFVI